MEKFTEVTSAVVPLNRSNVDTDAIIPKQFLKSIHRSGFGPYLFDEWRYLDKGEPGMDCSLRPINTEFVLNFPKYKKANILLAQENFGCGSSREHAPWALSDYGFKVIIAPSFADIFFNNCFKNGILPITLSQADVDELFSDEQQHGDYSLTVNLYQQRIHASNGKQWSFDIEEGRKDALLNGLDDIGLTLQQADEIRQFERNYQQRFPWLQSGVSSSTVNRGH